MIRAFRQPTHSSVSLRKQPKLESYLSVLLPKLDAKRAWPIRWRWPAQSARWPHGGGWQPRMAATASWTPVHWSPESPNPSRARPGAVGGAGGQRSASRRVAGGRRRVTPAGQVAPSKLRSFVERRYPSFLEDLEAMVNVDCGTFVVDGVRRIADMMQQRLEFAGW